MNKYRVESIRGADCINELMRHHAIGQLFEQSRAPFCVRIHVDTRRLVIEPRQEIGSFPATVLQPCHATQTPPPSHPPLRGVDAGTGGACFYCRRGPRGSDWRCAVGAQREKRRVRAIEPPAVVVLVEDPRIGASSAGANQPGADKAGHFGGHKAHGLFKCLRIRC